MLSGGLPEGLSKRVLAILPTGLPGGLFKRVLAVLAEGLPGGLSEEVSDILNTISSSWLTGGYFSLFISIFFFFSTGSSSVFG